MTAINPKSKMPFTVCCVVGSVADAAEYEEVVAVHQFCVENGVDYVCREFDPVLYEEDAFHIKTLPAFFIYECKRVTSGAFYAESDPLQRIHEEIVRVRTENGKTPWSALTNIFRRTNKIAISK